MTPKASKRVRQGIDRYPKHHERLREYRCCHPALLDKLCGNARRGESESRATFRFRIYTQASGDFSKQLHHEVKGQLTDNFIVRAIVRLARYEFGDMFFCCSHPVSPK